MITSCSHWFHKLFTSLPNGDTLRREGRISDSFIQLFMVPILISVSCHLLTSSIVQSSLMRTLAGVIADTLFLFLNSLQSSQSGRGHARVGRVRRDTPSAFPWSAPFRCLISKSYISMSTSHLANIPSASLKFLNQVKDAWSVLILKCLPCK